MKRLRLNRNNLNNDIRRGIVFYCQHRIGPPALGPNGVSGGEIARRATRQPNIDLSDRWQGLLP